jgi:hypothetical protein
MTTKQPRSLTKRQEEILSGLLLGDGHLSIGGRAINPRLRINRSAVDAEYQRWIRDEFHDMCSQKALGPVTDIYDARYDKTYQRVSLCTRRDMRFLPWHKKWYPGGHRTLPPIATLPPLTAAVWFADDGSLYDRKSQGGVEVKLATASFGKEGSQQLATLLNQTLKVEGFRVYGGYESQPHYRIVGSTKAARALVLYVRDVFPPVERKKRWWNGDNKVLDPDFVKNSCPLCGGRNTFRNGKCRGRQRYCCNDCSKRWKD